MRILFTSGNGYIPEFRGGVQSSTDYLARELRTMGHETFVQAALFGNGLAGLKARMNLKIVRRTYALDTALGYPVMRSWDPVRAVPDVIRAVGPDVALVQCQRSVPIARAFLDAGVPVVVYLRNVEFHELEGDPRSLKGVRFIANSPFTARKYKDVFGIDSAVILPSIDIDHYCTVTTGEFVTFINIDEKKGVDVALGIAERNPDIPFLFVESWVLEREALESFRSSISGIRNVTFMRCQADMKKVYGRTRILLAPSKWEEAWGRVASEAHCSGIPVIGSNRGGLPDAIGPGGVVVDHDAPSSSWDHAVRSLWFDGPAYIAISEKARRYASRDELVASHQVASLLNTLREAIDSKSE